MDLHLRSSIAAPWMLFLNANLCQSHVALSAAAHAAWEGPLVRVRGHACERRCLQRTLCPAQARGQTQVEILAQTGVTRTKSLPSSKSQAASRFGIKRELQPICQTLFPLHSPNSYCCPPTNPLSFKLPLPTCSHLHVHTHLFIITLDTAILPITIRYPHSLHR